MSMVGRKSLAEKLLGELEGQDVHDRAYLILYDFRESRAPTRFYENLQRISALTANGSSLVQLSAYRTTSLKAAIAAQALASGMGAETQLYEVTETSPDELRRRLEEAQADQAGEAC